MYEIIHHVNAVLLYDWKSWRIAAKANNSQAKQNGSANTLLCLIPYMIECFI